MTEVVLLFLAACATALATGLGAIPVLAAIGAWLFERRDISA